MPSRGILLACVSGDGLVEIVRERPRNLAGAAKKIAGNSTRRGDAVGSHAVANVWVPQYILPSALDSTGQDSSRCLKPTWLRGTAYVKLKSCHLPFISTPRFPLGVKVTRNAPAQHSGITESVCYGIVGDVFRFRCPTSATAKPGACRFAIGHRDRVVVL